ncbi:ENTH domain-containing protein [Scheffersomyces amazonensis]|uniref:ENTH domain-containing protein n=1 Tax=Scheffersomyces amazonensis TaxID=1078765 RepID=UPI00315DE4DF
MIDLFKSLKNLTNSTESRIKNATSSEPLGPYNHELIELARLSFDHSSLSTIENVIIKRLSVFNLDAKSNNNSHLNGLHLPNRNFSLRRSTSEKSTSSGSRRNSSGSLNSNSNSNLSSHSNLSSNSTLNPHSNTSGIAVIKRSNSLPSTKPSLIDLHDSSYLQLLKTLTVILYLIQNGSPHFIKWIKAIYNQYLTPILINIQIIPIPTKYLDSIKFKLVKIINLFENVNNLNQYKLNFNKLRYDMSIPGVKRNSIDNSTLVGSDNNNNNNNNNKTSTPMSPPSHYGHKRSNSIDYGSYSISSSNNNTLTNIIEEDDYHNNNNNINYSYNNNPFTKHDYQALFEPMTPPKQNDSITMNQLNYNYSPPPPHKSHRSSSKSHHHNYDQNHEDHHHHHHHDHNSPYSSFSS